MKLSQACPVKILDDAAFLLTARRRHSHDSIYASTAFLALSAEAHFAPPIMITLLLARSHFPKERTCIFIELASQPPRHFVPGNKSHPSRVTGTSFQKHAERNTKPFVAGKLSSIARIASQACVGCPLF